MSARDIIAVCQREIALHPNDCSGFVRAVAEACGVFLLGDANTIVSQLKAGTPLADATAAKAAAAVGQLVIGGVAATGHGHVVVVVDGLLEPGGYPYAFWGQYRGLKTSSGVINVGFTRGHGTVNYAFNRVDRDKVTYAAFKPLPGLLPRAKDGEGILIPIFT